MTDEEIEKALREISSSETLKRISTIDVIAKESLDYIRRLKTEIEQLEKELTEIEARNYRYEYQTDDETKEQIRKETAKESLIWLRNSLAIGELDSNDLKLLAEEFGIEVEDE